MSTTFLLDIAAQGDSLANSAAALASDVPVVKTQTIWDMIASGGWSGITIIAILFVMSIIAIYLFVERTSAINRASKVDSNFMNTIKMLVSEGKLKQAKSVCQQEDTAVARLISTR